MAYTGSICEAKIICTYMYSIMSKYTFDTEVSSTAFFPVFYECLHFSQSVVNSFENLSFFCLPKLGLVACVSWIFFTCQLVCSFLASCQSVSEQYKFCNLTAVIVVTSNKEACTGLSAYTYI